MLKALLPPLETERAHCDRCNDSFTTTDDLFRCPTCGRPAP